MNALNLLRVLVAYARGSSHVSCLPTHLWIESTSRCNLRCPMCPTGMGVSNQVTGFIDVDLFRSILDQVRGQSTVVYLHLAGEPLLHPRLAELVGLCRDNKVTSGFFTNGTMLTEQNGRQLITQGLDWLGFSFDGWDDESHATFRAGSKFERTLGAIESFLLLRRELGSRTPRTTLSMIELPATADPRARAGIQAVRERLEAAGLDEFSLTPAHRWAETPVPRPDLAGASTRNEPPTTRCPFPWSGLAIRWDGTYLACCLDLTGRMPLGRVQDMPLAEFWNSSRMREFRERMARLDLEPIPLCRDCHVVRDPKLFGLPRRVWNEFFEVVRVRLTRSKRQ